jgi:hypothetical protein
MGQSGQSIVRSGTVNSANTADRADGKPPLIGIDVWAEKSIAFTEETLP